MSEKGRGSKIVLQFTDDITSIPSGAAGAFAVTGKERIYVGGPLIDGDYQVYSVAQYPAERAWALSGPIALDSDYGVGYSEVTLLGTQIAYNYFGAGYEIANAFDKSESTRWYASGTVDRWIGLDFNRSAKTIRKFRVYINDGRFKGFVFEASNDNATWINLCSGDFPSAIQWNEYTFSNENSYRYYHLRCTSVYSGSNVSVAELEMFEPDRAYITPKVLESGEFIANGGYRLVWQADVPAGTAVSIEYATGALQGQWTEAANGESITADTKLWVKATLSTETAATAPVLQEIRAEVAEPPKNKLLMTMKPLKRFNNVEGQLTVTYSSAIGQLAGRGGLVADFTRAFTPTELEPVPHQNDAENIEIAGIAVTATRTRVYYTNGYDPENIELASISATGTLTHIDDL